MPLSFSEHVTSGGLSTVSSVHGLLAEPLRAPTHPHRHVKLSAGPCPVLGVSASRALWMRAGIVAWHVSVTCRTCHRALHSYTHLPKRPGIHQSVYHIFDGPQKPSEAWQACCTALMLSCTQPLQAWVYAVMLPWLAWPHSNQSMTDGSQSMTDGSHTSMTTKTFRGVLVLPC